MTPGANFDRQLAAGQEKSQISRLFDICHFSDDLLKTQDIAALNLLCASGLPGAEETNVEAYLVWLNEAAKIVEKETKRNYYKFLDHPEGFGNSQARFCILCLVTVLQRQCGVQYNPKWKGITPDNPPPKVFGKDARDVFIHAIIDGIGGTCGSLPVLYVAVGRRLGYPLMLVKGHRHLFLRWDDPNGKLWFHPERFNIEATGPGLHFLSDDHYRNWPHQISEEDIVAGIFLKSLSPQEELAEFLATRGFCLGLNGRLPEAVAVLAEAARLSPNNRYFALSHQSLLFYLTLRRRGHLFINGDLPGQGDWPDGPFWVKGLGGHDVLVQVPKPGFCLRFFSPPNLGRPLDQQMVQFPNGQWGEVLVPIHGSGSPMTAHWLRLTDGRIALIHKPVFGHFCPITSQKNGLPILPEDHASFLSRPWSTNSSSYLGGHEEIYLQHQIRAVAKIASHHQIPGLPQPERLAIPPGPKVPELPREASNCNFFN